MVVGVAWLTCCGVKSSDRLLASLADIVLRALVSKCSAATVRVRRPMSHESHLVVHVATLR